MCDDEVFRELGKQLNPTFEDSHPLNLVSCVGWLPLDGTSRLSCFGIRSTTRIWVAIDVHMALAGHVLLLDQP